MFSHYYARKRMIRRILWVAAAVMLAVSAAFAAGAVTENESSNPFATFDAVNWSFCSGVGGWSTDMRVLPDGSFTGDFHDGEMGETGENYPMGTVYYCTFYGKLSVVSQENENTWKVKVDTVRLKEKPATETIEDGVRYVTMDSVYGLAEGDEISFRGEWRDNEMGGAMHWTHRAGKGRRKGGWLERDGVRYE